jgi:putative transposase
VESHRRSHATYDTPRIHAELAAQGIHVGRKWVARLMTAAQIRGESRRKWLTTTVRDPQARPAPDLVQPSFTAAAPHQLWVADITYIPTWTGSLYLAEVLDAFRRRIVGLAMETSLRTELVLKAFNMALQQTAAHQHYSPLRPGEPVYLVRRRPTLRQGWCAALDGLQ